MLAPSKIVVRALFFSGLALALAVFAFKSFESDETQRQTQRIKAEKARHFSALCGDALGYSKIRFSEGKEDIELIKSDRWRLPSGRPIEDRELLVRLAHLRGLRVGELSAAPDLAALGLDPPAQRLQLFGGAKSCVVSLGIKHPSDEAYALMRQSDEKRRIGWVKIQTQGEGLIGLKGLRVRSPLPFSAGQIEAVEFVPQVGAKRFELRRKRDVFQLVHETKEQRADQLRSKELLDTLAGLRGEWVDDPPVLTDADLRLLVLHPPDSSQVEFFLAEERVYLRLGKSVFLLDENPLAKLMPGAGFLRDLQVVHYQRSALAALELHDGSGRVFRFRRQAAERGIDRWYEGDRLIEAGHRLAAMQWDLHTLRAENIVDELSDLDCDDHCRRVVVESSSGERSVDLRLERKEGGYLLRLSDGPVMRATAKKIDQWPFEGLR